MSFGNFRIDWRIFLFMKRDFYKILMKNKNKTNKNKTNKNKNKTNKTSKKSLK
jgi:hypothetical protein